MHGCREWRKRQPVVGNSTSVFLSVSGRPVAGSVAFISFVTSVGPSGDVLIQGSSSEAVTINPGASSGGCGRIVGRREYINHNLSFRWQPVVVVVVMVEKLWWWWACRHLQAFPSCY